MEKSVYILGAYNPFKINKGDFVIKGHFYQKSFFTGNSGIKNLKSKVQGVYENNEWLKKQLVSDITKEYIDCIYKSPSDYLVIDAVSSILPIMEIELENERALVSASNQMISFCNKIKGITINSKQYLIKRPKEEIFARLQNFCAEIKKVYSTDRIIINKLNYTDFYYINNQLIEKDDILKEKQRVNKEFINDIYNALIDNLAGCAVIEMPYYLGSQSSKDEFSYHKDYAIYVVQCINDIVDGRSVDSLKYNMIAYNTIVKEYLSTNKEQKVEARWNTIKTLVDEYEYKLECFNQKFRRYEEKFSELYAFVIGKEIDYNFLNKDQLSYAEFISLKESQPIIKTKQDSKLYRIFVLPWTKIQKFKMYVKEHGFRMAVKRTVKFIKEKVI